MIAALETDPSKWVTIIPDRLHFVSCDTSLSSDHRFHAFCIDGDDDFHYEKFYEDFGPLNLAILHKFCVRLKKKLDSKNFCKKEIVHYTIGSNAENRSNAAYLIGSYAILFLNQSADHIWSLLQEMDRLEPFLSFRDASPGESIYGLGLPDIFSAVEKAQSLGWINFEEFSVEEYEFYERVENGDLNWVLPNKILAFCGPHLKTVVEDGYPRHSPETYFNYFRQQNVTNVVRLNRKIYESHRFTQAGFGHHDLFFVDGSCPSNSIVLKFLKLVEEAPGAVAVHCKAGLGRTGTLIACYMMKHYGFTAPECIAWIRICRPGSIIGPQQLFLIHVQNWCRSLPGSKNLSPRRSPSNSPHQVRRFGGTEKSDAAIEVGLARFPTETITILDGRKSATATKKQGDHKQGDRLMKIKGKRGAITRPRRSCSPVCNQEDSVQPEPKAGSKTPPSPLPLHHKKRHKTKIPIQADGIETHQVEEPAQVLLVATTTTRRSRSRESSPASRRRSGSGGKTPPNRHKGGAGSRNRAATSKRTLPATSDGSGCKTSKVIVVIKNDSGQHSSDSDVMQQKSSVCRQCRSFSHKNNKTSSSLSSKKYKISPAKFLKSARQSLKNFPDQQQITDLSLSS